MTLDSYLKTLLSGSELAVVNIVSDNPTTYNSADGKRPSPVHGDCAGTKLGRAQSLYSITSYGSGFRNPNHQTSRWQNNISTRRMNSDSTLGKPKRRDSAEIDSSDVWKCMQNERRDVPFDAASSASSSDRLVAPNRSSRENGKEGIVDRSEYSVGEPPKRRTSDSLLASLGPMAPTRTNSMGSVDGDGADCDGESDGKQSKVKLPKKPAKTRLVRTPTPAHVQMNNVAPDAASNDNVAGSRTAEPSAIGEPSGKKEEESRSTPSPLSPHDRKLELKLQSTSTGSCPSSSQGFPPSLRELPYEPAPPPLGPPGIATWGKDPID